MSIEQYEQVIQKARELGTGIFSFSGGGTFNLETYGSGSRDGQ